MTCIGVCTNQTCLLTSAEWDLSSVRHLCSTTSLLFSYIFLPRSKCCESCSFPCQSCCSFGHLAINCAAPLYIHFVSVPQVQKIMGTTGRGKKENKVLIQVILCQLTEVVQLFSVSQFLRLFVWVFWSSPDAFCYFLLGWNLFWSSKRLFTTRNYYSSSSTRFTAIKWIKRNHFWPEHRSLISQN